MKSPQAAPDGTRDAPRPSEPPARRAVLADAAARGLALFFGLFSLANSVGRLLGGLAREDIWWIDLSFMPRGLATCFGVLAAMLLVLWSIAPRAVRVRRVATALSCAALAVAVCMAAFPLAQMLFFGTTDYRRPADAAVVLGARVYDDGTLSTALSDRVRTGVDLYRSGLVARLIMSGGIGANGVDETVAMRRRAIELGVPATAIVRDDLGIDTDASVADTTRIFRRLGIRKVLLVSQSWHLPRVKLAYLEAGWNVCTVPASTSTPIIQTPYLMLREIPAFWVYWARSF